jgi:CDGSH-type Zn-finger protein
MPATRITIANNGPIRVEGDCVVVDPEGKQFGLGGRTTIPLCRCGHSENKPFCDGSHKTSGFQHEVHARELPPLAPKPVTPAG